LKTQIDPVSKPLYFLGILKDGQIPQAQLSQIYKYHQQEGIFHMPERRYPSLEVLTEHFFSEINITRKKAAAFYERHIFVIYILNTGRAV
jgi:hypothetical protein